MKVYIQFDFEGIAGFVIRDNQDRNIPSVMERTKRMMKIATAEVSAAANGAFTAGADEVVVWDSHGRGNTLLVEELSERIELITGEYSKGPWLPFFEGSDVGMYVGGHAMDGTSRAITPHTKINVNGRDFGEVGMFINCCSGWNIPMVMVSGDTAVKREVQWQIPDSEIVVTKDAIGPTLAKTITPGLSCKLIYEAARRGIERAGQIEPFKNEMPFRFSMGNCSDVFVWDKNNDFTAAYREFLKEYGDYSKGWPEYNVRYEQDRCRV